MSAETFAPTHPQLVACPRHPISFPGLVRWFGLGTAWGVGLGCFLAIVLRLTWKDSIPELAPFFYATPLPLVWMGLAVTGFLFFALRKSRSALVSGLCAVVCWAWWLQSHTTAAVMEPSPATVRIVFWNTARLNAGWSPVAEQIQEMTSPLMGFVEAGADDPEDRLRWERAFPQHERIFFGNGMVLLAQGKVVQTTQGELAPGCYFGRADLEMNGETVTVFVVDIHSNPFFCRADALSTLHEVTQQAPSDTVLILGDFNTPTDSVHLQGLRKDFHNALEVAGQGTGETWPTPFPVLAIDHIWVNRRAAIRCAEQAWSVHSDHRAVIAELALSE